MDPSEYLSPEGSLGHLVRKKKSIDCSDMHEKQLFSPLVWNKQTRTLSEEAAVLMAEAALRSGSGKRTAPS